MKNTQFAFTSEPGPIVGAIGFGVDSTA